LPALPCSVYEQAVVLIIILEFFACLSVALLLWQWVAARRFPLHQRSIERQTKPNRSPPLPPAVTLLKPLKGCDAETEKCLRSWFNQEYTGTIQIMFGVASSNDPVCELVRQLIRAFPRIDAELLICGPLIGTNAKASKLAQLQKLAKHEVLIISDADVRAPSDFLAEAVAWLNGSGVPSGGQANRRAGLTGRRDSGLVNCFYRLANPTTLAMRWEAIAVNADFWSQVLQSKSLKPIDFALGAVMVTRRNLLDEIGGFESLANCLADDYQLGHRLAHKGYDIALCPLVVECWDAPQTWRSVWTHQLRWARTIRVCQPLPYFFSVLSNPIFWPLLWLLIAPSNGSIIFFVTALCARMLVTLDLQRRLARSLAHAPFVWLAPIKDLLQLAIWFGAFAGNRIEWRGQKFKLRKDGTLEPQPEKESGR
jgi:ceramide glucosyltransferase